MKIALIAVAALIAVGLMRGPAEPRVVRVGDNATGFVVDGRVVTVAHAVDDGDPRSDLAVVRTAGRVGKRVGGAGVRVLTLRGPVRASVKRRIRADVDGRVRDALEIRAAVRPGDSGAPLVDGRGHLLGVVFARSRSRPDVAYAVDAREVRALLVG